MGTGLGLVSLGLFLMHGIDAGSGWTALLPGQICAVLTRTSYHAFISAFHEIVIIALAVAAAGAIAGYALVRTRDLVASSRAPGAPAVRRDAAPPGAQPADAAA